MSQNDVSKLTAWLESQGFGLSAFPEAARSGLQRHGVPDPKRLQHRNSPLRDQRRKTHCQLDCDLRSSGLEWRRHRHSRDLRFPSQTDVRSPVSSGKFAVPIPVTQRPSGNIDYFVAPGDIATIYDLNPLYNAHAASTGRDRNSPSSDRRIFTWRTSADFRTGFGLNPITDARPTRVVLSRLAIPLPLIIFNTCWFQGLLIRAHPAHCGDMIESDLDIEWSGAIAQNAQIIFVNAPATFSSDCTASPTTVASMSPCSCHQSPAERNGAGNQHELWKLRDGDRFDGNRTTAGTPKASRS